jgi:hypothetical protein
MFFILLYDPFIVGISCYKILIWSFEFSFLNLINLTPNIFILFRGLSFLLILFFLLISGISFLPGDLIPGYKLLLILDLSNKLSYL